MLIWLLASQNDNRLPYDPARIQQRIACKSKIYLDNLLALDYLAMLYDDSDMLADIYPEASKSLSLDRDREESRNQREEGRCPPSSNSPPPTLPHLQDLYEKEILELFNQFPLAERQQFETYYKNDHPRQESRWIGMRDWFIRNAKDRRPDYE